MSLFGSLFSAVSGLTAQSQAMGMISDNIANVGTTESMIDVRENGVSGSVTLTIDSRKFRAVQHKNKQGRPYQAPGAREY